MDFDWNLPNSMERNGLITIDVFDCLESILGPTGSDDDAGVSLVSNEKRDQATARTLD